MKFLFNNSGVTDDDDMCIIGYPAPDCILTQISDSALLERQGPWKSGSSKEFVERRYQNI